MRKLTYSIIIGIVLMAMSVNTVAAANKNVDKVIYLKASRYGYLPSEIIVNQGDTVRIHLSSEDVTHGFYLEGYNLELEDTPSDDVANSIEFTASRSGKFYFRCSATCGPLHPIMVGKFTVLPSNGYYWFLLIIITGLMALWTTWRKRGLRVSNYGLKKIKLTHKWPILKQILLQRWFQYVAILPNLSVLVLIIATGLLGISVGSANLATVFVWLVWWPLLLLVLIPLTGRLWCAMCPIPAPGEWLERHSFIGKGLEKPRSVTVRKWPRRLKNIWLQLGTFLIATIFSASIITSPAGTAWILISLVVMSATLSLIFGRRVFCRYVCPIGGLIGLYALVAPLEVRVDDKMICREHRGQECAKGSDKSYGCPWVELPWNLDRNTYCGFCMECLKGCPENNVSVNLRPVGTDLLVKKGRNLDEAFKALVMVGCAFIYIAVFFGPWTWLKDLVSAGNGVSFILFALMVIVLSLIIFPICQYSAVWLGRSMGEKEKPSWKKLLLPILELKARMFFRSREPVLLQTDTYLDAFQEDEHLGKLPPLNSMFIDSSYTFIPLGLSVWMIFSISFLLANSGYILPVLSDPFGWGWDLFGTKEFVWKPYWAPWVKYFKLVVLLTGEYYAIKLGFEIYRNQNVDWARAWYANIPQAVLIITVTIMFGWLFLQ